MSINIDEDYIDVFLLHNNKKINGKSGSQNYYRIIAKDIGVKDDFQEINFKLVDNIELTINIKFKNKFSTQAISVKDRLKFFNQQKQEQKKPAEASHYVPKKIKMPDFLNKDTQKKEEENKKIVEPKKFDPKRIEEFKKVGETKKVEEDIPKKIEVPKKVEEPKIEEPEKVEEEPKKEEEPTKEEEPKKEEEFKKEEEEPKKEEESKQEEEVQKEEETNQEQEEVVNNENEVNNDLQNEEKEKENEVKEKIKEEQEKNQEEEKNKNNPPVTPIPTPIETTPTPTQNEESKKPPPKPRKSKEAPIPLIQKALSNDMSKNEGNTNKGLQKLNTFIVPSTKELKNKKTTTKIIEEDDFEILDIDELEETKKNEPTKIFLEPTKYSDYLEDQKKKE
jgi:hypothetical protein